MVTCQSANQLKTPPKVSWAFKIVSQFGSLGYTIMEKTADLTVVQKTIIDTLHKEGALGVQYLICRWFNEGINTIYMCVSTCPVSVIGKDRVLNELPFVLSTERCLRPIKKSSLIKGSAILLNVIKLDCIFSSVHHRTKLSSPVQLQVHSMRRERRITCI